MKVIGYYGSSSGGAGTGEANTGQNIGIAGVGIFKQKSGVALQFKKINAANSKITVTDDVGSDEVDIGLGTLTTSDVSGLGSIATQNANNVAITGGTVSGTGITLDTTNSTTQGRIWRDAANDRVVFRGASTNRTLLNSEDNLGNLSNFTTARNNLGFGLTYTVATLPASGFINQHVFISDALVPTGVGGVAVWNGTAWLMLPDLITPTNSYLIFFRELSRQGRNFRTNRSTWIFSDFSSSAAENQAAAITTASFVGLVSNSNFSNSTRSGTMQLNTGSAATGSAHSLTAPIIHSTSTIDAGTFYLGAKVAMPVLSTNVEEYAFKMGTNSAFGGGAGNNNFTSPGFGFIYDRVNATGSLSSGSNNWVLRVSQASATIVDTGITVPTNQMQTLEILGNASGIEFFINQTKVGSTITTNLPNLALTPHLTLLKSVGSNARTAFIDFFGCGIHYDSLLDRYAVG